MVHSYYSKSYRFALLALLRSYYSSSIASLCSLAAPLCQPCTRGFFCPDYTTILLCPQGHFCPTGSIAPRPCLEPGSYCPEGAPKQVFYGGVIVCLIIDAILLLGYACLRLAHWRNVRKRSREESRKMRGRQLGIAETTHSKKQAKFVTLCTDVDEEDDSLSSAPVRKSGIFSRRFWLKRLENAVNKLAIYFPIRFEVPQVPPPPVIAGMLSKPFKNLQQHHQEQLHRPATFMTSLQEHGQTVNRDHATMTVVSSLDNDHGMRTRTNGGMLRSINSIGSFLFPAPPATLPPPPPSSDTDSDMEGATTNALTPQPPRITVTVHGGEDETAQRVAQNVALDMRAAQSQTPTSMTTANGKNNNNNNPHHHYSLFFHEVLNGFHRAQDNRDLSLRFEFEKLSLTLPSGKTILSGVTGKISPGRVTVIMGPR